MASPVPGPSSEEHFAVIMIADISGFTKLTAWLDENIKNGQVRAPRTLSHNDEREARSLRPLGVFARRRSRRF